uniref:Glyoxalase/bleomycin resistance protein/dioxygenase n=1 Tax=Solibacter usitatus (strain Ellin6076) TaxID=234267 RepID=Q01QE7_SOLUE
MDRITSRRQLLRALGVAPLAATAFGQGRCRDGYGTPGCPLTAELATAPIKPVFDPTGWKTVALEQITFQMPDYRKETAFYIALMGWRLRSDDGRQAVLDIGNWGSAIFKEAPGQRPAVVHSLGFVIEPWNAAKVEAELRKRGLTPVADHDGKGFESFHVKDPDGLDLQVANGNGLAKTRKTPAAGAKVPLPFESPGWQTVWLDHVSYGVPNYKRTASFYTNLLGWEETYDEGSQHELLIGDVGDMIVRGGNPNSPEFGKAPQRTARIDHISYGISPWDTDGVKAALEKRGLRARVDTSTRDDIHVAAFKSYHTTTPNGYDLQISYLTHDTRLALANAVKPKAVR